MDKASYVPNYSLLYPLFLLNKTNNKKININAFYKNLKINKVNFGINPDLLTLTSEFDKFFLDHFGQANVDEYGLNFDNLLKVIFRMRNIITTKQSNFGAYFTTFNYLGRIGFIIPSDVYISTRFSCAKNIVTLNTDNVTNIESEILGGKIFKLTGNERQSSILKLTEEFYYYNSRDKQNFVNNIESLYNTNFKCLQLSYLKPVDYVSLYPFPNWCLIFLNNLQGETTSDLSLSTSANTSIDFVNQYFYNATLSVKYFNMKRSRAYQVQFYYSSPLTITTQFSFSENSRITYQEFFKRLLFLEISYIDNIPNIEKICVHSIRPSLSLIKTYASVEVDKFCDIVNEYGMPYCTKSENKRVCIIMGKGGGKSTLLRSLSAKYTNFTYVDSDYYGYWLNLISIRCGSLDNLKQICDVDKVLKAAMVEMHESIEEGTRLLSYLTLYMNKLFISSHVDSAFDSDLSDIKKRFIDHFVDLLSDDLVSIKHFDVLNYQYLYEKGLPLNIFYFSHTYSELAPTIQYNSYINVRPNYDTSHILIGRDGNDEFAIDRMVEPLLEDCYHQMRNTNAQCDEMLLRCKLLIDYDLKDLA